jgi:hypothetical protein
MQPILLGDPEAITQKLPIVALPAIIACVVTAQFGGFGILTFVHLFAFAILAASMTDYKTEKGLWMLALLFAAIWSGFIAMYSYGSIMDWRLGVAFNGAVAIDAFFTMFILRLMVRFLWKTARLNYLYSNDSAVTKS